MNTAAYRHEYKYLISAAQLELLRRRAGTLLKTDPHVAAAGKYAGLYSIRSVYFDDWNSTAYCENRDGVDPREKFRIRIYNHSDRRILLELKSKQQGKCRKQSCLLTRQQCQVLISGGCLPEGPDYPPLLQKLLVQIRTRLLRPVVMVEYERIPFVHPIGNVRVTLDCNIRSSPDCGRLFQQTLPMRPVLPPGHHILEVKWDMLLPDTIYRALMLESLQWCSMSKFYLCRRFAAGPSGRSQGV